MAKTASKALPRVHRSEIGRNAPGTRKVEGELGFVEAKQPSVLRY